MLKSCKMLRILYFNKIITKGLCSKGFIYKRLCFRNFNSIIKSENKVDNKYIYNVYKLNDIYYNNLKIINNYDEFYNLIIKNEYFKDYTQIRNRFCKEKDDIINNENTCDDTLYSDKNIMGKKNTILNDAANKRIEEDSDKNIINSNDLQVLYFGCYDNNNSIILFNKFKSIIEKNKKLQFYFIDVNLCPQGSYNCNIIFVPTIMLIYKNHIYRKKLEINYDQPVDDNYLNDFLSKVQQSIDYFHKYNNKYIYSLKKQSNYLNTKYIDIDNQNIHKENWNTF
ncbi:conserved Plasmodium protein, unknown function [Plasmodium sp. gorilla clade G1]|nr:conserved Plasmodium protein, unknown function [Plasmodium sp. gorilla clade G1]